VINCQKLQSLLHISISPFVIEKCIKSCAGEVKNVTKLKSGGLMIECQRKQQSLNLLKDGILEQ
jgi:uncharacterized alkaline shock family protein YloU